jgi:hypothetical protein
MALTDILGPDPLAQFEHEISIDRTLIRLQALFPEGIDRREALVLRSFAEEAPLSYWDDATVREVLKYLEQDLSRTFEAIDKRSDSLHRGLENLHRESPTKHLQDAYDHGRARELLIMANSFLPEYLRLMTIFEMLSPMGRLGSQGSTSNLGPNTQGNSVLRIFFAFSTI